MSKQEHKCQSFQVSYWLK